MNRRQAQCGAAILLAMLTVALVATFAAASLWQQWRSTEVEAAERARVQSSWILTGALDWARLLLREDARPGSAGVDHLGEPWAVPLQEARLSSFLAADKNSNSDMGPDVLDAFLSGTITDLQSKINLANMIDQSGVVRTEQVESLLMLFRVLSLPPAEAERLVENYRFALAALTTPQPQGQASLVPEKPEQLTWLGLSPETVTALLPYVTILPSGNVPVNVNTAPAPVIAAAALIDLGQAESIVQQRDRSYFRNPDDVYRILQGIPGAAPRAQSVGLDVRSSYFEVRARLRLDRWTVEERSMIRRSGTNVEVIRRERGALDASSALAALPSR
jgi:general secretion pathway protein K